MANVAHDNLVEALVYNVVALGRIIGPRASEYAQTTQTKVDEHKYPGGNKVTEAFIPDDFQVFDESVEQIYVIDETILDDAYSMKIFLRIQKIGRTSSHVG